MEVALATGLVKVTLFGLLPKDIYIMPVAFLVCLSLLLDLPQPLHHTCVPVIWMTCIISCARTRTPVGASGKWIIITYTSMCIVMVSRGIVNQMALSEKRQQGVAFLGLNQETRMNLMSNERDVCSNQ